MTANMGTGGHNVPLILSDRGIRKLTPRETFNVQGFPKDFKLPEIANGQLYKQAGNSVVVPVIKRIAIHFESIDNKKNACIYVDLKNRYEGESYLYSLISEDKLDDFIKNSLLPIITDEEYSKLVKKHVSKKFYSIISK